MEITVETGHLTRVRICIMEQALNGLIPEMPATMLQVLVNIRLLEQRIIISIFQERNIQ